MIMIGHSNSYQFNNALLRLYSNYQDMILIFNSQPRAVSVRISRPFACWASSLTRVTPQNDKASCHSLQGTTSHFVRNQLDLLLSFYLIFELSWNLTVLRCNLLHISFVIDFQFWTSKLVRAFSSTTQLWTPVLDSMKLLTLLSSNSHFWFQLSIL